MNLPRGVVARAGRTFRALAYPQYRLFWLCSLASFSAYWLQMTAQSWLVLELTDSALFLGLAGLAAAVPAFFLAPIAGAVADRVDRRRLLVAIQGALAALFAVLAALTLAGLVTVYYIIAIAFLVGAAQTFEWPARLAV